MAIPLIPPVGVAGNGSAALRLVATNAFTGQAEGAVADVKWTNAASPCASQLVDVPETETNFPIPAGARMLVILPATGAVPGTITVASAVGADGYELDAVVGGSVSLVEGNPVLLTAAPAITGARLVWI